MTTKTLLFIVATCALLGFAGFIQYRDATEPTRTLMSGKLAEEERVWTERIRSQGGKAAYAELAEALVNVTPALQHERAHAFGAALFAVEDTTGMSACDARFSYGCFHEFLGRSISEHGLAVVAELNEGCVKALVKSPLSCQHGIGHGILSFFGYDERALIKALGECERLPYSDPIGGCYGGALMEYNMQSMLGSQAVFRRADSEEDLYEPCASLSTQYQNACTFWQPQWWLSVILHGEGSEKVFAQLGENCRGMADTVALRRTCFEGIGNVTVPSADFSPERARELCDATSSSRLDRLYCRSFAANSLSFGGAGKTGDGTTLCNDLPERDRDFCLAYARNEANILNAFDSPS